MSEIVVLDLDEGGTLRVEVDDEVDGQGVSRVALGGAIVEEARRSLETAFAQVRSVGASAVKTIAAMPQRPDEIELKFGVKLDAQAGAVIAKTGTSAQFEVKLRWSGDVTASRATDEVDDGSPLAPGPS